MIVYSNDWGGLPLPEHWQHAYVLFLNPMQGRMESNTAVAASDSKDELIAFLRNERVDPYQDGQWRRAFKSGGPLKWYNPPTCEDRADDFGHGIVEMRRDGWRRVA